MSSQTELFILDSNLIIEENLTVNGIVYYVKTIADLDKIEGIRNITIPPISSSNEKVATTNSLSIDGNFIICEELKYTLSVNGTSTILNQEVI